MSLVVPTRTAPVTAPIHPHLADRWSPRSFDPTAELSENDVASLLEAARWAPSAANFQPRRFILTRRGSESFAKIVDALSEGNRPWAPLASLLVVGLAVTRNTDGQDFRWAEYDLGQAMAHLTVQAHELGLHVHQMGGFSPAALRESFGLPETAVPVTVSAIGRVAPAEQLPERYRARESADRTRLSLDTLVLVDD